MSPPPRPADPPLRGLTPAEAAARLAAEGPNELAAGRLPGVMHTLLGVMRESTDRPGEIARLLRRMIAIVAPTP